MPIGTGGRIRTAAAVAHGCDDSRVCRDVAGVSARRRYRGRWLEPVGAMHRQRPPAQRVEPRHRLRRLGADRVDQRVEPGAPGQELRERQRAGVEGRGEASAIAREERIRTTRSADKRQHRRPVRRPGPLGAGRIGAGQTARSERPGLGDAGVGHDELRHVVGQALGQPQRPAHRRGIGSGRLAATGRRQQLVRSLVEIRRAAVHHPGHRYEHRAPARGMRNEGVVAQVVGDAAGWDRLPVVHADTLAQRRHPTIEAAGAGGRRSTGAATPDGTR